MSITKLMSKLVEIELTQDVVSKALLMAMQSGKDTPVKLSVSLPNPLEINVKPLVLPRVKLEKTPTQVLTREEVLKILSMRFIDKKSGGEITKVFPKVNRSTVYAILSGRTWKDVYNEFMTKHKINKIKIQSRHHVYLTNRKQCIYFLYVLLHKPNRLYVIKS